MHEIKSDITKVIIDKWYKCNNYNDFFDSLHAYFKSKFTDFVSYKPVFSGDIFRLSIKLKKGRGYVVNIDKSDLTKGLHLNNTFDTNIKDTNDK